MASSFPSPAGNHIFRLVHPFVRVCYANGCPTRCRACIGRTSYNPHITKTGCGANVLAPCGCTTIVSPSSRLSYQIGPPHPFPFLFHWSPTFTDGRNPQLVRLRPHQPQQVPSRASTPVGPHVVAPAVRRRAPSAHHRHAVVGGDMGASVRRSWPATRVAIAAAASRAAPAVGARRPVGTRAADAAWHRAAAADARCRTRSIARATHP